MLKVVEWESPSQLLIDYKSEHIAALGLSRLFLLYWVTLEANMGVRVALVTQKSSEGYARAVLLAVDISRRYVAFEFSYSYCPVMLHRYLLQ